MTVIGPSASKMHSLSIILSREKSIVSVDQLIRMFLQANLRARVFLRTHGDGESLNDVDGLSKKPFIGMGEVVMMCSDAYPSKVDVHDLLPGGNVFKCSACATIRGFADRRCVQENIDLRLAVTAAYGSDSSMRDRAGVPGDADEGGGEDGSTQSSQSVNKSPTSPNLAMASSRNRSTWSKLDTSVTTERMLSLGMI